MATDLLAQAGFTAPDVSRMGSWLVYLFIAILIACLLALSFYLVIMRLKFNKKLVLNKETITSLNMSKVKGAEKEAPTSGVATCDCTMICTLPCFSRLVC